MSSNSSRRRFLTTGLAVPAAGIAATGRRSNLNDVPLRLAASEDPPLRFRVHADAVVRDGQNPTLAARAGRWLRRQPRSRITPPPSRRLPLAAS